MAFPNTASILVEDSEDFILASIMFQQRPKGVGSPTSYSGVDVDPSSNFVVKEVTPGTVVTTPGYEQVVLYKRGNSGK
jgi:hypothetical protein